MKTALFGGTFDPVHNGHLAIAQEVLTHGFADQVLFVPAPRPPHKAECELTPFEIRLEMLSLAVSGQKGFSVSDMEKLRHGRSYTIDTLKQASQFYRNDSILLLLGGDSLRQLHTWRCAKEIAGRFGVLSYPRPGEPVSRAELLRHWTEKETEKLLSGFLPSMPVFNVSSTEIRGMIRSGQWELASKLLPSAVAEYIRKHKIYMEPNSREKNDDGNRNQKERR